MGSFAEPIIFLVIDLASALSNSEASHELLIHHIDTSKRKALDAHSRQKPLISLEHFMRTVLCVPSTNSLNADQGTREGPYNQKGIQLTLPFRLCLYYL